MAIDDWEARYQAMQAPSGDPDPLVMEIAGGVQSGRALDLACGAGANTLWLAERGWDVTAVDRSPAAIEIVRRSAALRGAHVTALVADLEAHEFVIAPGSWDLILMCRYLQRDLFEPAKLGLAPDGALIVIALLADSGKHRFRVEPGELARCFADSSGWTIIQQRERATRDHAVSEIVVRRDIG
ncbi:MAG TPA: methyltransferase domain-containing protein [Bryobacteraceae bacterium]|nr:methyltransferase domain-containing protein [Bryobacteraceae bacterium]